MRYAYLLILAIAHSAYAEDPFACVDPDVADAFLGDSYRGRGEYLTSIPQGFVNLAVPSGLSLVGSQKANSMTTVVYKTSMGADQALGSAVRAMTEAGWTEKEQRHGRVRGGFQTSSRPTATARTNPTSR